MKVYQKLIHASGSRKVHKFFLPLVKPTNSHLRLTPSPVRDSDNRIQACHSPLNEVGPDQDDGTQDKSWRHASRVEPICGTEQLMGRYSRAFGPHDPAVTYVEHSFEEHVLDTGEVRLNYAVAGPDDRPALLLIPGQTESWWGY